jgi:hypothetical protein
VLSQLLPDDRAGHGGPASALAELDRIELLLSGFSSDEDAISVVTARLHTMLDRLGGGRGDASRQHLQTASDDELFDFIHRELGRS